MQDFPGGEPAGAEQNLGGQAGFRDAGDHGSGPSQGFGHTAHQGTTNAAAAVVLGDPEPFDLEFIVEQPVDQKPDRMISGAVDEGDTIPGQGGPTRERVG